MSAQVFDLLYWQQPTTIGEAKRELDVKKLKGPDITSNDVGWLIVLLSVLINWLNLAEMAELMLS